MTDRTHENFDPMFKSDVDVLVGRIVDGEASRAERIRFETMALEDPSMWRLLALRQQDMAMLGIHVEPTLNVGEHIDIHRFPANQTAAGSADVDFDARRTLEVHRSRRQGPWWVMASGWAAMVALALAWMVSTMNNGTGETSTHRVLEADSRSTGVQSPEAHLEQYLSAPYVLGEMPPTLLNADQLPDGRYAVSYLRRIVEVKYYDRPEDIPVDAEGNLLSSPREVPRSHVPGTSEPRHN